MSIEEALAFWIAAPGRGEIRRERLKAPASEDLIVQALYSGVSRGTEALVFRGEVPASEHQRMRAPFQEGEFPAPVKYGYASVGRVVHGPPAWLDRQVFCLHPHQTAYVLPLAAAQLLPPGLPAARAVLAANLETAVNGVWDADVRPGDRVAVVGGGSVGLLAAWLCARIPGCEVQLIDSNAARETIARQLGCGFALPDEADVDADVVLHASGSADGLALALRLAAFEATVVELSWYGDREVTVALGEAFHSRRLQIRSSQVGAVAAVQRGRWSHARRLQLALRLLHHPELDALVNSESRFSELPQVMADLATNPRDVILHRVVYD
ncbi:MAG TPA: zinc-binding alcohol dehydrogenase [Steroidobacteraceae bacterium]|nr:zinc-binding alcohol dehydrogenase [Steroidobacteraceae bacterium]